MRDITNKLFKCRQRLKELFFKCLSFCYTASNNLTNLFIPCPVEESVNTKMFNRVRYTLPVS